MGKQRAKSLDTLLEFQQPKSENDGAGNETRGYVKAFSEPAALLYRRGGERDLGMRLEARQPLVITVRKTLRTLDIQHDWRAVSKGTVFSVLEQPTISRTDRRFLEMLAEATVRNEGAE